MEMYQEGNSLWSILTHLKLSFRKWYCMDELTL